MEYKIVNRINIKYDECVKIGEFLYNKNNDGIYSETPGFPFPVQIALTHGLSKCEITKGFTRLPFILKSWINSDILLRMVDLLKLALKDKILMHASCVDDTLIVGLPNSGKTYQTYKSVSQGGTLISEEYTVIDGTKAMPYKPVMRTCFSPTTIKDCNIEVTFHEKFNLFLSGIRAFVMPFMFEHCIWKEIPVDGNKSSQIKKIVYGSSGVEVKDWRSFAILCENEFPFMSSELLQAYALAGGLDLLGIQARQRLLIKDFVEKIYPKKK